MDLACIYDKGYRFSESASLCKLHDVLFWEIINDSSRGGIKAVDLNDRLRNYYLRHGIECIAKDEGLDWYVPINDKDIYARFQNRSYRINEEEYRQRPYSQLFLRSAGTYKQAIESEIDYIAYVVHRHYKKMSTKFRLDL